MSQALTRHPRDLIDGLSPRLREIVELVAKGLTNDEIAGLLGISPHTVRTQMTAIFAQIEVTNRTEAATAFVAFAAAPARVADVLRRPAIAVLPFEAPAGDARARIAAVGVAHDLAALFARWCWFPVISNSSSASARVEGGSCSELARRLDARFLVDGELRLSPRPADDTWRLRVRIDDAADGQCLWTESIDFPAAGVFAVQDAVVESIVAQAYPVLVARAAPPASRHPESLEAWELTHAAMSLQAAREPAANRRALEHLAEALRREPSLVVAHFGTGLASYEELLNQWGPADAATARLLAAAQRCIELAPHAAEGFFLLGRHAQSTGDQAGAVVPLETAIARNPSFARAHALLAQALEMNGRSDEALARMKDAVRLGPRSFVAGLAVLHFARAEYADALRAAEDAVASSPRYTFARATAAASAWWLGDRARARAHLRALREHSPSFEPAGFFATFGPRVSAVERFYEAFRALEAPRGRRKR